MTANPLMDDRYVDGVYYDGTVGECYKFGRDTDAQEAILKDPVTGEEVERLDFKEFHDLQPDLYQVPEKAIRDPANYYAEYVSQHTESAEFDVGFLYAQAKTEIVEKGDE